MISVPHASRPPYCSMSASCCSPLSTIPFCIVSSLNVPGGAALHARAVVAGDVDHQRVVELAHLLDRVQDPADVPVGVLQEAREDLHLASQQRPLLLRDRVPRRERLVARRQLRVGRDHPELLLTLERLLAIGVPALVEAALVALAPLRRDVVGRVRAAGRVVDEPRLVGLLRAHAVQPLDRLVGHRVGQVEALLLRRPDRRLVLRDHRVVLARLAAQEAPEVVEPEPVGPAVERARRTLLMVRRQMPLAERRRAVAVLLQHPRKRRRVLREERRVAREARRELTDRAEADRVVVAARQQRRARRRAQRRDVERVVAQAIVRQARHRRRRHLARRTCSADRSPRRRPARAGRSARPPAPSGC